MCAPHLLVLMMVVTALPTLAGVSGAGPELVPAGGGGGGGGGGVVVAAAGRDVELHCTVLRLGDKSVSWVRSRDLQILTHAGAVFTADARVSASSRASGPGTTVHSLRIAGLRPGDAGRYECQLNTEPKMSLLFNLTVLEHALPVPVVSIVGGARRVRVSAGGVATLACEAHYEPPLEELTLPSLQIRWSHGGEPLDATSSRGGVSLEAERWAGGARSSLTLAEVRAADAGAYWCSAGGTRAQLHLQVLDSAAGAAEAMQGDAAAAAAAGTAEAVKPLARLGLALSCALMVLRALGP